MWRTTLQRFASTAAKRTAQRSQRRFISISPQPLQSSLPGTIFRWGLAAGLVVWYNTSSIFAEQPPYSVNDYVSDDYKNSPRLEELSKSARFKPPHSDDAPTIPAQPSSNSPPSLNPKAAPPAAEQMDEGSATGAAIDGPAQLEEEASQQGAFNEETGEINWDCPCLGGMAHGPCGEDFKAAFSCFVYSTEEPKGMDCIDKFKGMQDCFRQHPDVYGEEIAEDEQVEPEQALRDAEEEEKEHQAMQERMKSSAPMNSSIGGETSKDAAAALKDKSDGSKATFVDGKLDGTVRTALDPAAASDAKTAAVADASDVKESSEGSEKSQ